MKYSQDIFPSLVDGGSDYQTMGAESGNAGLAAYRLEYSALNQLTLDEALRR